MEENRKEIRKLITRDGYDTILYPQLCFREVPRIQEGFVVDTRSV
jgi:hypothetical protein